MARTPKARALGNALRQAREDHGLTLRALATQISRDAGVVSRWETGDRTPKPEQVAQILTVLGVNGDRYDEIINLTYGTDEPQWVATTLPEQHQQLTAFVAFEQNATKVIEVSPLLVPGLLQSSAYVRAMMSGGGVPATEIATRVAIRIGRKDGVTRHDPVHLVALVGEAVLHQIVGSPEIMAEQLRHLLDMSQRSNIDLRIIPYNGGWSPALEGSFIIIESDQATVVFLENRKSGLFLHEDTDVNAYRRSADMVLRVALSPDESVKMIAAAAKRWENMK